MNWETSFVKSLNHWGQSHVSLVELVANKFVYLAILIGALSFIYTQYREATKPIFSALNIRVTITEGLLKLVFPVGIAAVVSEIISKLFDRARPFVDHSDIKLLFAHSADGGLPSHHMVFTVAIAVCVMGWSLKTSYVVLALALLSGIARVAAGIHYPTDILLGILIGALIPWIFSKFLRALKVSKNRS